MTVLVTGATGLIGGNLVRELLRHGDRVRVLLRPGSDTGGLAGLPLERVTGDLLDTPSLHAAADGCATIYHCATAFSYWGVDPMELTKVAVEGSRNVVAAARAKRVERVVLTASSLVFGSSPEPVVRDERARIGPDEPTSPYLAAKLAQWQDARHAARRARVPLVSVCPTVTVGAYDRRLSPSNAMLVNYLSDPFHSTFPGGVNLVSVADVARGHLLAARRGRPGASYILGGENLHWVELHRLIAELLGLPGPALQATRFSSYLAAAGWELYAGLTGRRPPVTRDEARMVGRFYWFSHDLAATLGYRPTGARAALAVALSWLVASPHVSADVRRTLRVGAEVYAGRDAWAAPPVPAARGAR